MPSSSLDAERLAALHRYDILDTPTDERFDRVTRLAARLFEAPIALITLVDEDRQWFKSCLGLDRRETEREISFCTYNVQAESVMVVEDAREDPRFADNPLVTGAPGIRFYAGAPLVTPDGHILGSLCVIDTTPRSAGTVDLAALRDLAQMVMSELELRRANADLQDRNEQVHALTRELKRADEADRSQLSHLLHEELQQSLQAARMQLENACSTVDLSPTQETRLEGVTDMLDDAIGVTRTLAARFAPPVGNQPLRDTLDWLALKMREDHDLPVSVMGSGAVPGGDETIKTLLYRLVRELLFRIARTTAPHAARVHLIESTGRLRITVEDDGREAGGDGDLLDSAGELADIWDQIEGLGGRLTARSSGTGPSTCVTIEVPTPNGQPSRWVSTGPSGPTFENGTSERQASSRP
jgi:GAF domain-containing protein